MSDPRYDFTATLLLDGRVLVAGGNRAYQASPRALASAELYDPARGTWTATGSMLTGRYRHAATLLPDGRVLVSGGNVDSSGVVGIRCCLATAELYDPSTGTWTATGSMNAPRVDHWAGLLRDGTVVVVGGDAYPNTGLDRFPVERYDPRSGAWSATGSTIDATGSTIDASVGRGPGTVLPDGRVLFLESTLYDPTTGSWSSTSNCCAGGGSDTYGGGGTATLLSDGEVLRAGGIGHFYDGSKVTYTSLSTAALYDPASGKWLATGSMQLGRVEAAAVLMPDGRVLVMGGQDGDSLEAIASAELYNPVTGRWTAAASMAQARFGAIAILLLDGRVLVVGGAGRSVGEYITRPLATGELYDSGAGS